MTNVNETVYQTAWSSDAAFGCSQLLPDEREAVDQVIEALAKNHPLTQVPHCRFTMNQYEEGTFTWEIWVTEDTYVEAWMQGELLRIRNVQGNEPDWPTVLGMPTPNGAVGRATNTATEVAARIAGYKRYYLYKEWATVLQGAPESSIVFSDRRRLSLALGFIGAALRMRAHDVVRPAWRPVDWLLSVPSRTNAFITATVGTQAVYIVGDGGLGALATEIWEPCGIAGASLYALSRWLRRVRGIELATVESESADE
ncbi:hypothetical protein ACFWWC_28900 [Streptomyces sp. NPDC058642]|uniref:hypothetical protein n=1 Tax=Streptomyces sp. NPDC058642 TaxID=3346572 RepID=UPI0036638308